MSYYAVKYLEHLPDPLKTLDEFRRLLKIGGKLIITAPFNSLVTFCALFISCRVSVDTGNEYHLPERGFEIEELTPNGGLVWPLKRRR